MLWCYFQELRCRFQSDAVVLFFKNLDLVFNVLLCCCCCCGVAVMLFYKNLDVIFNGWLCCYFSRRCSGVDFQELRCRFQCVAVVLFFKNLDVIFNVLLLLLLFNNLNIAFKMSLCYFLRT
jgi:hypothetical protein